MARSFDWLGGFPAWILLLPPVCIIATLVAVGVALHRARLRRYRAIAAHTGLSVKAGMVTRRTGGRSG